MSHAHIKLAVSVLTGGLLITTLAGCSIIGGTSPTTPAAEPSAPVGALPATSAPVVSTPVATAPSSGGASVSTGATLDPTVARIGAAESVEAFYNQTFGVSTATIKKVQSLNTDLAKQLTSTDTSICTTYSKKVEALMPGLKYINSKGVDTCKHAGEEYGYTLIVLPVVASLSGKVHYAVDDAQVQLSDNNTEADVPAAAVTATLNGKTGPNSSTAVLHTVYESGMWYLDTASS